MIFRYLFYISAVLGPLCTLSFPSYGMMMREDELLNSPGVRIATIPKQTNRSKDISTAFAKFEELGEVIPAIKESKYKPCIYREHRSPENCLQLICSNNTDAAKLCQSLETGPLSKYNPRVILPAQISRENLPLELFASYYWKQQSS